jgi:hypothetical protein
MHVDLVIERISSNKLNDEKLKEQVDEITSAANKRQQSQGVKGRHTKVEGPEQRPDGYFYTFKVRLEKTKFRSEVAAQKCLEHGKKFVIRAAETRQWRVKGDVNEVKERAIAAAERGNFNVGPLTDEVKEEYFDGIYERDAHIRLIHRATMTAIKTNFEERSHVLLWGQPAAAKTILFKRLKSWYEADSNGVERVAMVNSTTISKAGLETWLLENAKDGLLPEIICFDEIEKFNMDNLQCLLSIMDDQAKISRTNARIGKVEANAKVMVWATCNDIQKLKDFNRGALFSRFNKRYQCVRPSRELMMEIMCKKLEKREEQGCNVDFAWAKAAVDYAFDKMKTNDPRTIIGLLDGEDALLDGSYFKDIEAIEDAARIADSCNLT